MATFGSKKGSDKPEEQPVKVPRSLRGGSKGGFDASRTMKPTKGGYAKPEDEWPKR